MYKLNTYQDVYTVYEFMSEDGSSWFRIVPERGGIVTSFGVNGEELLYLDHDTYKDPQANVRGGIPVLFPICGQLHDAKYSLHGRTYHMKNHGVARTNPWSVIDTRTEDKRASITLELNDNADTQKEFPFSFTLRFEYVLEDNTLTIHQTYLNRSSEDMPMYAGFHPYFKTTSKNLVYETDATTYLDYNDNEEKPIQGKIDLTNLVESVTLLDAKRRQIAFEPSENRKIILAYSEPFQYVVLWSVQGKPFICVEPWMAKTFALHTGEDVQHIAPNAELEASLTLSVHDHNRDED